MSERISRKRIRYAKAVLEQVVIPQVEREMAETEPHSFGSTEYRLELEGFRGMMRFAQFVLAGGADIWDVVNPIREAYAEIRETGPLERIIASRYSREQLKDLMKGEPVNE